MLKLLVVVVFDECLVASIVNPSSVSANCSKLHCDIHDTDHRPSTIAPRAPGQREELQHKHTTCLQNVCLVRRCAAWRVAEAEISINLRGANLTRRVNATATATADADANAAHNTTPQRTNDANDRTVQTNERYKQCKRTNDANERKMQTNERCKRTMQTNERSIEKAIQISQQHNTTLRESVWQWEWQ